MIKSNILKSKTNFYLAYQQKYDLEINKKYFELLSKIYPDDKKINLDAFIKNKIFLYLDFFISIQYQKYFLNL